MAKEVTPYRQRVGRWGEKTAEDYLAAKGWHILERNIRSQYGEIDLLAQDGDMLVFVEVKTRTSSTFGLPEAGVTKTKQQHMLAAAQHYLQNHPDMNLDWRIDVIAILRSSPGKPVEISHFENALT